MQLLSSLMRKYRFLVAAAGVLIFVLMSALPEEAYLIDDLGLIDLPQIRAPGSLQLVATWFGWKSHVDFYPFRDLTYWVDLHILGASPSGLGGTVHRVHNLIWLLGSGAILLGILRKLGTSSERAAIIVALWLLLPLHLETVLWISARKDVLSLFFCLAFVRICLEAAERRFLSSVTLGVIAFVLGQLSKASFTLLPIAMWVAFRLDSREKEKRARGLLLSTSLLGIAFSLLQSRFYSEVNDMRYFYEASYRIQASLAALGRMTLGAFWAPINAIDLENWGGWFETNRQFLIPGAAVLLVVVALTWRFRWDPIRRWGLLGFWATYLPVSAWLFPHRNFYSTRYLEIPLLFLVIGAVGGLKEGSPRTFRTLSLILLFLLSVQLHREIRHWETAQGPFQKAWVQNPENPALGRYFLRELERLQRWGRLDEEGRATLQALRQRLRSLCGEAVDADSFRNGHLCLNLWIDERFRSSTVGIQGDLSSRISRALNDVNPDQGRFLKLWSEVESRIRGGTELPISSSELLELRTVTPERRVNALAAVCAGGDERLARARRDRWLSHSLLSQEELAEAHRFWKNKFPNQADQLRGCLLGPRK